MPDNESKQKLKIDDNEYYIDSLSDETKGIINGLKAADAQLRLYQDTIKLLTISKNKLVVDLQKSLKGIEPIN